MKHAKWWVVIRAMVMTVMVVGNLSVPLYAENLQADSALFKAAQSDDIAGMKKALDEGANPNTVKYNFSVLQTLAVKGSIPGMELLLSRGADLDAKLGRGNRTALMQAAYKGNMESIRFLLARGAKTNLVDFDDCDALWLAVNADCAEVAEVLLDATAFVDCKSRYLDTTPLVMAVERGQLELVRKLLARGASTELCSINALAMAREKGNVEMIGMVEKAIQEKSQLGSR